MIYVVSVFGEMARVTCHNPYYLSNIINHLRDYKSIPGPQFGLILVHNFVDRLSSTLVHRAKPIISMKVHCLELVCPHEVFR